MNPRLYRLVLVPALLIGGAGFGPLSCLISDGERQEDQPLYPVVRQPDSTGHMTVEFGKGRLRTTSNQGWWGIDSVVFASVVESRHSPVVVQVSGLNLSGIGELLWPPDTSDIGATVLLSLGGPRDISVQLSSALVRPEFPRGPPDRPTATEPKHRAFVFIGRSHLGWFASRAFKTDAWNPSSLTTHAAFDLRVRYENLSVSYWVREHKSLARVLRGDAMECPADPVMNTAVVRRSVAVSGGRCWTVPTVSNERGDWIFVGERVWDERDTSMPMSLKLSVRNWRKAKGPYVVTWDNLTISGVPDAHVPSVFGRGEFLARATGALADLSTFQDTARFSLVATQTGPTDNARAAFGFRAGDLEIASLGIRWSLMRPGVVSFGGNATVNDLRGFRFDVSAVDGGDGDQADKLQVNLFSASNAYTVPVYSAFGVLPADAISVRAP